MTTHEPDAEPVPARFAARAAVAGGLAVLTWLVALVAAGVVARIEPASPLSIAPVFVVLLMVAPLYKLAPWRPEPGGRVLGWLRTNRAAVGVAVVLLLLRTIPFTPGPLVGLLDLPFRSAGFLFGVELFYRELVGPGAGVFVRQFAQWYLEALWLLVIGGLLADFGRWVR